jgi:hypothetical protein
MIDSSKKVRGRSNQKDEDGQVYAALSKDLFMDELVHRRITRDIFERALD